MKQTLYSWVSLTPVLVWIFSIFAVMLVCFPVACVRYFLYEERFTYTLHFYDSAILNLLDHAFAHLVYILARAFSDARELYLYLCGYSKFIFSFIPDVYDDKTDKKSAATDVHDVDQNVFTNWARSVCSCPHFSPCRMVILRSKQDIIDLMHYNKSCGYAHKIRICQYSHTFSNMFCGQTSDRCILCTRQEGHESQECDGSFTVSSKATTSYLVARMLPARWIALNPTKIPQCYNADYTETWVEGFPLMYVKLNLTDNTIVVGGATPILMFYNLCEHRAAHGLKHGLDSYLSFPSECANVMQLHQSFVGTHCIPCHGSGVHTKNLPSNVRRVKMINYAGDEVVYKYPEHSKFFAHFGLLGVVTEMEICGTQSYACLYTPRVNSYSNYMFSACKGLKSYESELERDVTESHYNEVFWVPLRPNLAMTHSFKATSDFDKMQFFPNGYVTRELQRLEASFGQLMTVCLIPRVTNTEQEYPLCNNLVVFFVSRGLKYLFFSPTQKNKIRKIPSFQGLHPYYNIQGRRFISYEWMFPLASKEASVNKSGSSLLAPDCTLAVKLFDGAKQLLNDKYHSKGLYPINYVLEMRIFGATDELMFCMNKVGKKDGLKRDYDFVCSVEVVSSIDGAWLDEVYQQLTDLWLDIVEKSEEPELVKYCRPHWGKYWQNVKVKNKDIMHHLKMSYRKDIQQFNVLRKQADPCNVFVNNMFEQFFDL